jgi:HD-GYP domain-containing protein (c-di-GMP phosphodiesterase class II)
MPEELRRCAGGQFDPFVVDAFVSSLAGPGARQNAGQPNEAQPVYLPGGLRHSRG